MTVLEASCTHQYMTCVCICGVDVANMSFLYYCAVLEVVKFRFWFLLEVKLLFFPTLFSVENQIVSYKQKPVTLSKMWCKQFTKY